MSPKSYPMKFFYKKLIQHGKRGISLVKAVYVPSIAGRQYALSPTSSIAIEKAQMISLGQMQNIFKMLKAVKFL